MSRLKALKRGTKLAFAGTLAVALIAAGVGVGVWLAVDSEDPRPASRALQGPETTYQYVAGLCGKIDWSMLEDEFGPVGHTQETETPSASGTEGVSVCSYPFGDDLEGFTSGVNLRAFVKDSEKRALDAVQNQNQTQKAPENGDLFFPNLDYSKIGGFTENRPVNDANERWLENLELVVQKGNLAIEITVYLWTRSKPDTDTPLDDDALAMQVAVSLTDQIEQLTHK